MNYQPAKRALEHIFKAGSVAVVGASNDPGKFGYMTLDSIIKGGFQGEIYPVNPKGGEILGLQAYASLAEIPGAIDLAVIIVPARFVPGVMREAAECDVRGVVILTAGFREAGREDLEEELVAIAREGGPRFVGPNVQGINYLPNKLCAMFFPVITTRGPITVITQSGSATAALSEWAAYEGLGITAAVNLGNQADLCESDYLSFFAGDEHTKAIAMYLEGLKDGRRFLETVRRVAPVKPLAILKAGRSQAGRRAASSHTGSMAGSQRIFEAACRQFGAVCANTIEDLYDCTKALATLKEPKGARVLSISTSAGMGALAADEADALGLSLPPLPEAFVEAFKRRDLSPLAGLANPLDLGYVPVEVFQETALLADRHEVADVILLNLGDPMPGAVEAARHLTDHMKAGLAVCYLGGGEEERKGRVAMQRMGIPVYPSPERAMRGIAAAVTSARYRKAYRDSAAHDVPGQPVSFLTLNGE